MAQWAVSSDMVTTFTISKVISLDHPSGPVTDSPMADPHKVAREMGLMVQMESPTSLTTEQLVHRIVDNRDKYVNRNKTREAKEMDYLQNATGFVAEE